MLVEGDHLFRIIKYPETLLAKEEGAAPHTDSNFFTLLPPATSKGLEVLFNEKWMPVIVPPNAVIVNVGSMLEHMTNGFFHAAVHRVVKHEDVKDRYAIAFFVHSRENDAMTPLSSCIQLTGGEQKYPEATRQELLDQRLIAMDRATKEKISKFASSGLIERWKKFLGQNDSRKSLQHELQKVAESVAKITNG
jgi:isopenicillin N synthase-like dioxygenase